VANKDHGPRVGSDPELFVQDAEGNTVPICGKIGGTKEHPLIIDHLVEANYGAERRRLRRPEDVEGNYAIQEDNVMLEFNTPAYKESSQFVDSISKMLAVLSDHVLPRHNLTLKFEASHSFKADELVKYPQAFTIGCSPDLNAYAEGTRERQPFNATHFGNNRFCGGHIHVQYNHASVPRHIFVQFMDVMVELPFMRYDKQKLRRMFYGQPGIYREKPYGIEYRTPSNFWLNRVFRERHLMQMVDNVLYLARTANDNPEELKRIYAEIDWADVQAAIRGEDAKMADEIIDHARHKVGLYVCPPATR